MSQAVDVLCMGNAIVDIIAPVEDDFLLTHAVPKGGMMLIDEARAEALYAAMGPVSVISGGSAANTAVGIASFGLSAAYTGKVRTDEVGGFFSKDLRATGVRFDTTPAATGPATARSYILVTPDGQRTMNTYLGACQNLTVADVDPALVASAGVTYLEGYLFDPVSARAAFELIAEADAVAPIPLHRSRLFARRYNQAAEIARPLSRLVGVRYLPDALTRTRATEIQGGKSGRGRRQNVRAAFVVADRLRGRVEGRRVLLVDDVLTTGATAEACAKALLSAGARAVDVAVVARVRDSSDLPI